MSHCYDWIVVGAGVSGAPLAYELQKQGQRVLLLEQAQKPYNATTFSYGGIPYWAGSTPWHQQLCRESRQLFSQLDLELEGSTEYRELDLLLYLRPEDESGTIAQSLGACLIRPNYLTASEAVLLEPQLNPAAVGGAFVVPHGHINPSKTMGAYGQAFRRWGGDMAVARVESWEPQGVKTDGGYYWAERLVLCAGAGGRQLLLGQGFDLPLYFSQAQVIITAPAALGLQTLVMPARMQRQQLEARADQLDWHKPTAQIAGEILEAGAIQFLDGHFCLGQISQLVTDPSYQPDRRLGEARIREAIAKILPQLGTLAGECHTVAVAFNPSPYPLVGRLNQQANWYLFTGFSSPWCYAPPLARHFARAVTGGTSTIFETVNQQWGGTGV